MACCCQSACHLLHTHGDSALWAQQRTRCLLQLLWWNRVCFLFHRACFNRNCCALLVDLLVAHTFVATSSLLVRRATWTRKRAVNFAFCQRSHVQLLSCIHTYTCTYACTSWLSCNACNALLLQLFVATANCCPRRCRRLAIAADIFVAAFADNCYYLFEHVVSSAGCRCCYYCCDCFAALVGKLQHALLWCLHGCLRRAAWPMLPIFHQYARTHTHTHTYIQKHFSVYIQRAFIVMLVPHNQMPREIIEQFHFTLLSNWRFANVYTLFRSSAPLHLRAMLLVSSCLLAALRPVFVLVSMSSALLFLL